MYEVVNNFLQKLKHFLGKISGTKCNRADRHTDRFQSISIASSQDVSVFL